MLILKNLCHHLNTQAADSRHAADSLILSFRLDPNESRLYIGWSAEVDGKPANVWINALELSDLNGAGVCDYDDMLKALATHRDTLERCANLLWIDGQDEVVLELGGLTALFEAERRFMPNPTAPSGNGRPAAMG